MIRIAIFLASMVLLCCSPGFAGVQSNPACFIGHVSIVNANEPLSALPGFLFSSYPASSLPDGPNGPPVGGFPGWEPYLITAQVTSASGVGISGCSVTWKATNGYFFSTSPNAKTDAQGIVSGYLRGDAETVVLTASLDGADQADTQLFTVRPGNHNNIAPAIYGSFLTPESSEFMVDIIPTASLPYTFYEVIGQGGAFYTGLQTLNTSNQRAFIFSVWGTENCEKYPQIVNDPTNICSPAAQGAEGCVVQCFDAKATWKVNSKYRFNVFASPAMRTEKNPIAGTNYQMVVSDVDANKILYDITIWAPVAQNIQNPSTFIEQFAGNTNSCMRAGTRQALWISPQYKPINGTQYLPSNFMQVSRPFDVIYGMGSMCFNYSFAGIGPLGFVTMSGVPVGGNGQLLVEPQITKNASTIIDTSSVQQYSVVQLGAQFYGINLNNKSHVKADMLANSSNMIYGDDQCPVLGNNNTLNLGQCADFCLNTRGCTSISVAAEDCVLRGCTTLDAPRTSGASVGGYTSYTMTPASFSSDVKPFSVVQLGDKFYSINASNIAQVKTSMLENSSDMIYLDNQCPNLGNMPTLNPEQCVDACLRTNSCTSISASATDCVLRGCTTLDAPTFNGDSIGGYKSYTMTPASFCSANGESVMTEREVARTLLTQWGIPKEAIAHLQK